jgi:CheY-like chemotaxis protein
MNDVILKLSVLLDQAINRKIIRSMLMRGGYEVECVNNGLEAIEAVKVKNYDCVLMDVEVNSSRAFVASFRCVALRCVALSN